MSLWACSRALLLALAILPLGAAYASADDGRHDERPDRRGPLPQTGGRPHRLPEADLPLASARPASGADGAPVAVPPTEPTTLVIVVGGYGSTARDGAFDEIKARVEKDPRFKVVRLGDDGNPRYDSYAPLDTSADALITKVRTEGPRYPGGVHIVSHSAGGAVVDRAFARGLSAQDGVVTFEAIAAPHNGSTIAGATERVLPMLGGARNFVRAVLMFFGQPDPDSAAMRDLARAKPVWPPPGVIETDYVLANDTMVLQRDGHNPGVPQRVYRPATPDEIASGHYGSLVNRRLVTDVETTMECRCVVADGRTKPEAAADQRMRDQSTVFTRILLALAVCLLLGFAAWWHLQPSLLRTKLDALARTYLRTRGR